jgi:3-dehydroquinate dehydratase II
MNILVLHGPNLDILHRRDASLYGGRPLEDLNTDLVELGQSLGIDVVCRQSNHEGVLIDTLNTLPEDYDGIIFNPGGYTHTSVALADAVDALSVPIVEVHLSNIAAREEIRQRSLISPHSTGCIMGLGAMGYELALRWLALTLGDGG